MNIQWLFVGGPAHGKTVWVKAGNSVRWADDDGKEHKYRGHDYRLDGKFYRVGARSVEDIQDGEVRSMLRAAAVEPIE